MISKNSSLLFDVSTLSICLYARPGSNYGVGRVAAGFASVLPDYFNDQFRISSMRFSAESGLLLDREYSDLSHYNIEPPASAIERTAISWVNMMEEEGGLRQGLLHKVKRHIWNNYNNNIRWKLHPKAVRSYNDSRLIHTELDLSTEERCPKAKRVVTIHDLIQIKNPLSNPEDAARYGAKLRSEWHKGTVFCCDSEYTANDLREFLSDDSERIVATPLGIDPIFKPLTDQEALGIWLEKLSIREDENYIIAHTGEINRKNLVAIIEVVHLIRQSGYPEMKLVLAGYPKQLHKQFHEMVPKHIRWMGFVRFTGSLIDKDFPILYSGASLMLFLSKAEGFGLPPLEAMACGLPLVCSNKTSLPEVVGDGGILVDPDNREETLAAVLSILKNPTLRDSLITKGLNRADILTWQKTGVSLSAAWKIALES